MNRYKVTQVLSHSAEYEAGDAEDAVRQYGDDYDGYSIQWEEETLAERIPEETNLGWIQHNKFLKAMTEEQNPIKKIWYELSEISNRCGFILMDQADAEEKRTGISIACFDDFPMDSVRERVREAIEEIETEYPELFK